jgi:hypothetical protein
MNGMEKEGDLPPVKRMTRPAKSGIVLLSKSLNMIATVAFVFVWSVWSHTSTGRTRFYRLWKASLLGSCARRQLKTS